VEPALEISTPFSDRLESIACDGRASRCDARAVLSEFAGAANELRTGAFIVNPQDVSV
jgi:trehalose-6-phosphate synthase